jgi:signal transduction histidine kinase
VEDLSQELARLDAGCAALVDRLRPGSLLEVPLRAHERVLGAIRLFSGPERLPPGSRERRLAEELGRRAAQAIENALLYLQAREAIRLREDFVSIASHELRTPLSALSLQLDLLDGLVRSGKLEVAPAREADLQRRVESGVRQVDRLTKLVNSLLDLARLRAGKLELELERFDLCELLREIAGRFEETLAHARRQLRVATELPAFGRWDRSRLDQLVTNLIANAVKYGDGAIRAGIQARDGWAVLTVHDDGPGIPPDELDRIFERYIQGSGAKRSGGLGLGLFIARKIVEAHGGRIRAESQPGAGTTFSVELPCEAMALPALDPAAVARAGRTVPPARA